LRWVAVWWVIWRDLRPASYCVAFRSFRFRPACLRRWIVRSRENRHQRQHGQEPDWQFLSAQLVLADSAVLASLPPREMRAGYAEIIKYGLIMDASFYGWCLEHGAALLAGDTAAIEHAVMQSCRMKAAIVEADEREADKRALLNFGHTFAHALEAETGFGASLIHGEAVAIGMVMACRLSARMGLIDHALEQQLAKHFKALSLMHHPRDVAGKLWNADAISSHFSEDKKAEAGKLTFIILDALGDARVAKHVDAAMARDVVASFIEE